MTSSATTFVEGLTIDREIFANSFYQSNEVVLVDVYMLLVNSDSSKCTANTSSVREEVTDNLTLEAAPQKNFFHNTCW